MKLASIRNRFFSVLINILSSLAFGGVLGYYFYAPIANFCFRAFLNSDSGWDYFENAKVGLGVVGGMFLFSILHGLTEGLIGQSLGKWIMSIRIVSVKNGQIKRSWNFIRALIKYMLPVTTLVTGLSGYFFISSLGQIIAVIVFFGTFLMIQRSKRALHDILSRTVVISIA